MKPIESLLLVVLTLAAVPFDGSAADAQSATRDRAPRSVAPPRGLALEREVFTWSDGPRRDPFAPAVRRERPPAMPGDLVLRGIMFAGDGGSLAVFSGGGKTFRGRRGDQIGGARILEIRATAVLLSFEAPGGRLTRVLALKSARGAER